MYISPVGSNYQSFKGAVIVNNLKKGTVEKLITDKKMDKELKESFEDILNNRMFVMRSKKECLTNLKNCIGKFGEIVGKDLGKDLKYPATKDISVAYSSAKDISKLDVPGYFSVVHSVK